MTNRDFYNAVANLDNAPEDIKSYAENAIKALNDKNSARNAKVKEKKNAENAPYIEGILNILADGNPHTCGEIAKALDTQEKWIMLPSPPSRLTRERQLLTLLPTNTKRESNLPFLFR